MIEVTVKMNLGCSKFIDGFRIQLAIQLDRVSPLA